MVPRGVKSRQMSDPYTVLHGGFHKTATTFLQKSLQRNKGRLLREGTYYVPHRDLRKEYTVPCQQNAYQAIGIKRKTVIDDPTLHKIAEKFFKPIKAKSPERIILSDENLAGHCGNCIKTGQLYRYRDPFIASFAKEVPYPVREIFLSVRNYADFFAAAYVEYFRSLQSDSTQITTSRRMRTRVFNHMPGWNGVINVISKHFPHARIYLWKFEDFVADPDMAPKLLQKLAGDAVDVHEFDAPKGNSKRQSASARAMAVLELMALTDGVENVVAQRRDIQSGYPRNKTNGTFDPWDPWERAHLLRLYDRDMARLATNRHVTLLTPDNLG